MIDFYNVGENKSFEDIAGTDEASKLVEIKTSICFGVDKSCGDCDSIFKDEQDVKTCGEWWP